MIEYFNKRQEVPLMGLSIVARLQETPFFKKVGNGFICRQVSNKIIFFYSSVGTKQKQELTDKQIEGLESVKFTGQMSHRTQKKVIQICQNWRDTLDKINSINNVKAGKRFRQINLLTLTLTDKQITSDNEVKRNILIPFIQKLIYHNSGLNYLWKAEPQRNGNIHFHLLLDQFIDKDNLRYWWNSILKLHGYNSFDNERFDKYGAPSTRIESLRNKDNGIAYVSKYITKNEGQRGIDGRLWGCNNELRELRPIESRLCKNDAIELINNVARSSNDIIVGERYAIIKNVPDRLIHRYIADKSYLYNNNLMYNVSRLSEIKISPIDALKSTTWYKDIQNSFGAINTSYLENNGLLFGMHEYIME